MRERPPSWLLPLKPAQKGRLELPESHFPQGVQLSSQLLNTLLNLGITSSLGSFLTFSTAPWQALSYFLRCHLVVQAAHFPYLYLSSAHQGYPYQVVLM